MTTDNDDIVVGLIGAGGNTQLRHIPGLRAQPGVEIKGLVNRSRESSERVAGEFEIPEVYEDWVELLEDDDLDAVCIGTWPYMHAPLVIETLEADKHVLCEARMAMNSDEALEMLEASKRAPHLVAQIVPAPHSLEIDSTIINLISEGYIGDLVNVKLHVGTGSDFPNPDLPLHWRHNRDLSGNNIMTMGIWYEAMMRWFGPAKNRPSTRTNHRQAPPRRRRPPPFNLHPRPHRHHDGDGMRRNHGLHNHRRLSLHPRTRPLHPRHRRRNPRRTRRS